MGPDGIHPETLREWKPLSAIYHQSWLTRELQVEVSKCDAYYKKGQKEDPGKYRPVSLTSVPGKVMEHKIFSAIMQHVQDNQGIRPSQQGFKKHRFSLTNLISVYDKVTSLMKKGQIVDVDYFDSSKPLTVFAIAFSWRNWIVTT